jgi:hypothetical protein
MQGKLNRLLPLGEIASGVQEIVINIVPNEKCSIQVNYAALSAGDMQLEASNDGVNYAVITDSEQAMDVAGGSHIWNVDNMFFKWLRSHYLLVQSRLKFCCLQCSNSEGVMNTCLNINAANVGGARRTSAEVTAYYAMSCCSFY